MQYRRAYQTGGSYFFTLVTNERKKILVDETMIETLRNACRQVMIKRPFSIDAMVVLPDHIHCIWTLPPGDDDFSTRWRLIKTWFTKHCNNKIEKSNHPIWQLRFWEHLIRDDKDYQQHVEYIHYNPVKHGYVKQPLDWPFSSFHRYVAAGIYTEDWGCSDINFNENIGSE